jgi:hypothetical protein
MRLVVNTRSPRYSEDQRAAFAEYPVKVLQKTCDVWNMFNHFSAQNRVEALVFQWQLDTVVVERTVLLSLAEFRRNRDVHWQVFDRGVEQTAPRPLPCAYVDECTADIFEWLSQKLIDR